MDVAQSYVALRNEQRNAEASQLLASDAVFQTPSDTVTGPEAILAFWNANPTTKDSPKFEDEIIEISPSVFQRKGTVKKMMMTVKLLQTISVADGKVTGVKLAKA